MTAPISPFATLKQDLACDKIAEYWVKYEGGLDAWKDRYPEMLELFAGEIEYRRGRINLASVTDTWEEYGLDRADFERLNRNIESWIVCHM